MTLKRDGAVRRNIAVQNSPIEIEALRLATDGSGVGRDETGITTFVPGLLPGEIGSVTITERKKKWQRGELQKIIKSSPERIDPPCRVFSVCGGCQLQHLEYQETLKWKRIWVEDALKRIGKLDLSGVTVHPTIGMEEPWRYRNKARLHMDSQGRLGYYREKTNDTVVFPDCLLLSERMNHWIKTAERNLLKQKYQVFDLSASESTEKLSETSVNQLQVSKTAIGADYNLTWRENTKGEGLLIIEPLKGRGKSYTLLDPEGRYQLNESDCDKNDYDLDEQDVLVSEMVRRIYLTEEVMGLKFRVSPLAFLQVNPKQTEALYAKTLEYAALTGNETVWDLYCGIGTITLALAQHAREVIGIEENPYAIYDAKQNAALNGLDNVRFIQGRTEERLKSIISDITARPDVIVLDPPRAGVDPKGLEQIINVAPQRIVYVSCDPGTLARDLGRLAEAGYQIREVQPVDMFSWSYHVETVVLITRVKK